MTKSSLFKLPLLQAINDWQIGGNAKQKAKRGIELEKQAQVLPPQFRACALACFRQIALKKGDLWRLADTLELPETISAWTVLPEVARKLKGGVPPQGEYQGVIFCIPPPDGSVILNLDRLYRDPDFLKSIRAEEPNIKRFADGIGRYRNEQHEVVIQLKQVALADIHELGGYSSGLEELAKLYFGREPTVDDLKKFKQLASAAKVELGPDWVGGDAKDRVLKKIQAQMPRLRTIKKMQERAKL